MIDTISCTDVKQKRIAIYARVSTDEQSADAQLRDLREYVNNRGWPEVSEHVDEGVSGSKDSRPAWNELWDAIQKGRTKTLVVHALDRLGRSLPHLVRIITACVEKNVTLVSFRENLDLSTAQGRMIAGIFSVLAEYELAMIRERTRCGMRAAKARGSQIGPRRHYCDKERATQLRDEGWGQIRIAKELGVGVGRVNKHVFRTESFNDRNALVASSSIDNAVRFREAEALHDCCMGEYEVLHLENDELLDLLRTGYHQGCDTVVLDATTQNTSVEFTAQVAEMILAIANAPDVAGEVRARFSLSLF